MKLNSMIIKRDFSIYLIAEFDILSQQPQFSLLIRQILVI